jgi:hypothetical protein
MPESRQARDYLRAVRFRMREILAIDAARELTDETTSAFIRRATLEDARRLIEATGDDK